MFHEGFVRVSNNDHRKFPQRSRYKFLLLHISALTVSVQKREIFTALSHIATTVIYMHAQGEREKDNKESERAARDGASCTTVDATSD